MIYNKIFSKTVIVLLIVIASYAMYALMQSERSLAACSTALPTNRGQVISTINASSGGNFRVWSRIKAPDNTNNSFKLQIDDVLCNVTVGDASISPNTWTWVDYSAGNQSSKINVNLATGVHTITMAGNEDGVLLDRVILTLDTNCVPTGTGDNCAPPDTTAPTLSITSPANNASVQGNLAINVNATDNAAVSKVELYLGSQLITTDTTSPYTLQWDTSQLSNSTKTITVKAYDSSGNTATANRTFIINNPIGTATSLFNNQIPSDANEDVDGSAVELGMKFQVRTPGKITGVKFYKTSGNTGTHVGSLWSSTGTRLANVTFSNESTTGWQQANFTSPVNVLPDTTYVVSYHSPNGRYLGNDNYFSNEKINMPIVGLKDGTDGGNGVYKYGLAGSFPNETFNSENYWVDVVYQAEGTTPQPSGGSDINGDGTVNIFDLSKLLSKWNTSDSVADINKDATVNIFDLSILLSNWTI